MANMIRINKLYINSPKVDFEHSSVSFNIYLIFPPPPLCIQCIKIVNINRSGDIIIKFIDSRFFTFYIFASNMQG